ncbi:sugar ABC transporter permease [Micromonospora phytophila]|uniref:sugar ABC transporter permease n=1 Tax=Micromonospora phytophila TaxID=709888 RepID=UPI00202DBADA|nr:sugar ABC transporter permease [Micromonospora phytophila]MCM0674536.1 sugar ABC transporter permease [Micromonospora phytophila]
MSTSTTSPEPPAGDSVQTGPGGGDGFSPLTAMRRRVRTGELGAWPVIIGLIVIWVVFQSLNDRFLSPQNLSNLTLQIAATGTISVGVVLVLLLGEIDLSVGSVAGVAAAALAVLTVRNGWGDVAAIIVALLLGMAIGAVQGSIFARLGVPAFVVTLAGNIGWQGLQLFLLKPEGTINLPYTGFIGRITHVNLGYGTGWLLGALAVLAYAAAVLLDTRRRVAAGLPTRSMPRSLLRIVGLAVLVAVAVGVLNAWQGVPAALLILLALVVVMDLVLRRTRYGRSIFAVGGNVEAARRAGINVTLIRISVFALTSTLAALGGILIASRGYAAGQATGAADTLLVAIAAAVIGGVSLFGGRGSTYGALLGSLVLGSITSGMFLLQLDSSVRFMITAAVLLAAVILDSVSRRGRRSSGRA